MQKIIQQIIGIFFIFTLILFGKARFNLCEISLEDTTGRIKKNLLYL